MPGTPRYSEWERREAERGAARAELLRRLEEALPRVIRILADYGVREAYLFGSSVAGHPRVHPDIDIAVAGCQKTELFRLAADLERALPAPLDLVDLDHAPADFAQMVRQHGRALLAPSESA